MKDTDYMKQQIGKDWRYLQENYRNQRNISCKDGQNRDKKSMNLTEAKDIKKRRPEYTKL